MWGVIDGLLRRADDAAAEERDNTPAFEPEDRPGPAPPPELATLTMVEGDLAVMPPDFGERDGRHLSEIGEQWLHADAGAVRDLQEVR